VRFSIPKPKTKEDWCFIMDFCQAVSAANKKELAAFILLVAQRKVKENASDPKNAKQSSDT
jgi:hypothetical protein